MTATPTPTETQEIEETPTETQEIEETPTETATATATATGTPGDGGRGVAQPAPHLPGELVTRCTAFTVTTAREGEVVQVDVPPCTNVRHLRITVDGTVFDPSFAAATYRTKPFLLNDAPGRVATYLSLTSSLTSRQVRSIDIFFTVDRSRLEALGLEPEEVVMSRWIDGTWWDLPTRVVERGDEVLFVSSTRGLSAFAIRGAAPGPVRPTGTPIVTPSPTATPTGHWVEISPTPSPTSTPLPALRLPLAGLTLAAAAYAVRRRGGE